MLPTKIAPYSRKLLLIVCLLWIATGASPASARQITGSPLYLPLVMNGFNGTWHWQEAETLALKPEPNTSNPQWVVIRPDGRVHLLWDTISSSQGFIYQTYQTPQGWSPVGPIAQTLGSSSLEYAPASDKNGNIHLVWKAWLGVSAENPYRLMHARFDGTQWQESLVYQSDSSYVRGLPHMDDAGNILVTYFGNIVSSEPAYQTQWTSGGWTAPVEIDPSHTSVLTRPDMHGGVHFYAQDYINKRLTYSYWWNGMFLVESRLVDGYIGGRQAQLDGQNNLHLYWTGQVPIPGGSVQGIHRQCLKSGDLAFSPVEYLSGETAIDGQPEFASDGISQVVLGWKQANTDRLWLVIWDGCHETERVSVSIPIEYDWALQAVGISAIPRKVCALARQDFSATNYTLLCAEY